MCKCFLHNRTFVYLVEERLTIPSLVIIDGHHTVLYVPFNVGSENLVLMESEHNSQLMIFYLLTRLVYIAFM